jgi:nicotinate-nucleotide pyrophosphorylase (carboxylating)
VVVNISTQIFSALKEDHAQQDITSAVFIPVQHRSTAVLKAKQKGIFCGEKIVEVFSKKFKNKIKINSKIKDGAHIKPGQTLFILKGQTQTLLSIERTLLNYLQHLSGIATLTHQYVLKVKPYGCKILDTRKTIPGLRELAKYAVVCGGGTNHRFHLADQVLIKDNHLKINSCLSIKKLIMLSKKYKLEVEAADHKQALALSALPVDRIMLDNFKIPQLKKTIAVLRKLHPYLEIEVSGGITLKNISGYAAAKPHYLSIGAITHSAPALDLSMKIL